MKRQITNYSRWHQICLKWFLWLECLLLLMDSSMAQLTQQELLNTCSSLRIQEALQANDPDSAVGLMCDASGMIITGDIAWALQGVGDSQATPLPIAEPKYTTDFNRLTVHNPDTNDDGLYSCTFSGDSMETTRDAGCIFVLGTAKYATCPDHTSPCSETVPMVTSPEEFVLDVRIDFYLQGSSGRTQQIHQFNLFNGSGQDAIYTCNNEGASFGVPCGDSGRIIVEGNRSHKYDIILRFTNSEFEDSGNYTAVMEVENPQTSGRNDLIKTFMVTVNQPGPEPLELGFINDSPDVQGNNISASIQFSRPVDTLRCSLTGIPYQDCASGSVTFTNVPPREDDRPYILRVEGETTDGVRTVIRRLVRIEQPNICTVQLINDGVTVDGNSVTIQFSSRGPAVEFLCSLDRQPLQPCSMTQTFSGLSVGDHRVKIVPEGCGSNRRPLVVRFTV